ncbi:MAG: SCP2 sterol-binding domain-containing protein [Gammaproteobacteria bacterium]
MKLSAGINRNLESAFNRYLRLDPAAGDRLAGLDGRVIALEMRGLDLMLVFRVQGQGIAFIDEPDRKPDTLLRGTPLGFTRMGLGRGNATGTLFSGDVEISGDVETGQSFKAVLDAIDIDWEEQLARFTGDMLAHRLGNAARHAGSWVGHARLTLEQDLSEYLQEELHVVPTRIEIENLIEDIGRLGMDTDRLEARLRRMLAARGDA